MSKTGKISKKFKSFVAKTKGSPKVGKSVSDTSIVLNLEKSDFPQNFEFVEADPSLGPALQARENLANYRTFLETTPENPKEHYDVVYMTMSKAFSEITDKTATLQAQLEKSKKGLEEIDEQVKQKEDEKSQLEKKVKELNGETRNLKVELHKLKEEAESLQKQIKATDRYKFNLNRFYLYYEEMVSKKMIGALKNDKSKLETEKLKRQLEHVKVEVEANKKEMEKEILESEESVKKLTCLIKLQEKKEKEASPQKKQAVVEEEEPQTATFVINDNVKVSQEEIKQLKFMISAIQTENQQLTQERDSKMMDIDCISQENLGLKQIIRQMTEG